MKIYFAELEIEEEDFYRQQLPGHELHFVHSLCETSEDAEILSTTAPCVIDRSFLDAHPRLRCLALRSEIADEIDIQACGERGIAVCIAPDYGVGSVAEHTIALLLALSRHLRESMSDTNQAKKTPRGAVRGFDLCGKTLGIIGMERSGQRVAVLARAFEMRIIAYDPITMPPSLAAELGFEWVSFDTLLVESDAITLHVRLTPATHHLLDRTTLARCRRGVIIVNTARGGLIETKALSEALDSGQVAGAGLDVLEELRLMRESASKIITEQIVEKLQSDVEPHEIQHGGRMENLHNLVTSESLLNRSNVAFTPHVAANSFEAVQRLNSLTAENIRSFAEGRLMNAIGGLGNFPRVA